MTSPLPGEHEFDSPGIDKLRDSAVDAIAWALIDNSMDTADRQPSEEAYRAAVEQARALLPTLVRRSVVSTPSDEVTVAAERAVHRHLSRLSKRDDWAEDDTAIGGQAAFIVRALTEDGLLASVVSAPPTITDDQRTLSLSPDEIEWLLQAAQMVRHETEHPTATVALRAALEEGANDD